MRMSAQCQLSLTSRKNALTPTAWIVLQHHDKSAVGNAKRMPRRGDVQKTLEGINTNPSPITHHPSPITQSPFILMLQHDPTAWREKILPECNAQLTLSGHTHGGQVSLFGWSPAALSYQDYEGMVYEGSRAMYVSTGLGALIPFRFSLPGEIVVITLHTLK